MRRSRTPIEPLRKSRTLPLSVADTFELFTAKIETWWPLGSHSIAHAAATGVRFEPQVGGRVVELTTSGQEHSWADVLTWDPPQRFVLAWHPSVRPLDEVGATIVDVSFVALADAETRIDLVHRGWEELGESEGREMRTGYDSGWDGVLSGLPGA